MFRLTQEPSSGSYNHKHAHHGKSYIFVLLSNFYYILISFLMPCLIWIPLLQSEYAAITLTTSAPTCTVEQDL